MDVSAELDRSAPLALIDRMVVLRFPDEEALQKWWKSDAYQAAIPFRHKAAMTYLSLK